MYAYAKTEDMGALEEFMSGQHQANLQLVGDRVFDEGLYEAARAIFAHIPNWGRLASTLVRLHQFQQAVDAARKANSPRTWKEVRACLPPAGERAHILAGMHACATCRSISAALAASGPIREHTESMFRHEDGCRHSCMDLFLMCAAPPCVCVAQKNTVILKCWGAVGPTPNMCSIRQVHDVTLAPHRSAMRAWRSMSSAWRSSAA